MATTATAPVVDRLASAKLVKQADGSYHYVHGEVSMPLDFETLTKAMEQIDKSGPETYRKLALAMELPVEPFSVKHLRPVLVAGVQIVWHRAHGATEEDLEIILKKQQGRVDRYMTDLKELKEKPPTTPKTTKLKDSFKGGGGGGAKAGGGGAKAGQTYRLNPALKTTWEKFDKQKGIVVRAFGTCGGNATTAQLVEVINALPEGEKMTTTQPVERVCAFYLAEWKRNGLVEVVEGAPAAAAPATTTPVAPTTPAAEAPAATQAAPVDTAKLDTGKKNKKKGGKD